MNATLQCLTYTAPLALFLEDSGKHVKGESIDFICSVILDITICHRLKASNAECRSPFCAYCELRLHISKALDNPHRVVVPTALARGLRRIQN